MKKIIGVVLMASLALTFITGCKGKDSVANDPKSVVVAFFERMSKKDLDGAAKLATKDSKGTIEMMKKGLEAAEKMKGLKDATEKDPTEEFKKMTFGEAKIDGESATVAITNPDKGNETFDFPLKKEGGSWKVDFSMGTLMKMGMDKAGKSNDFPTMDDSDSTGTHTMPNLDSLTEGLDKAQEMLKNIKPEDLEKAKDLLKELEKVKEN